MIIGSNPYVRNLDFSAIPPTLINGFQIRIVDDARNLGVHLSLNLTRNRYIYHISQRVHASLHKLKFQKNSLSTQLRIKLVSILFLPHLDYCCLVYHSLSDKLNTKLQRLLKSMWNTAVGIKNCKQLFSLRLAFTTQKKATHTAEMMSV